MERRMERLGLVTLARKRTFQLPTTLAEARLGLRERRLLVAIRLALGAKMVAAMGLMV